MAQQFIPSSGSTGAGASALPAGVVAAAPWVALAGAGAAYHESEGVHNWDDVWDLSAGPKVARHYAEKYPEWGKISPSESIAEFSEGDIEGAIKNEPLIRAIRKAI